jgi:hypothetical protein
MEHIQIALPVLRMMTWITGVVGGLMVVAGLGLVLLGATGDATIDVFGAKLRTTNIGLGSIFCGLLVVLFVFRRLLRAIVDLGAIGEITRPKLPPLRAGRKK